MKLKTTQWIAISATALLVVVIYLFADTKKPAAPKPEGPMASRDAKKDEAPAFDWDGYMNKVKAGITSSDTLKLLANWEKGASEADLRSLIAYYHGRGESVVEAHYTLQLGLQRRDSLLARAGDLFSATSAISNDEDMRHYLMDQAVESYQRALDRDSSVDNKLKLASAYMDQGTAPMQGVGILLGVVAKDSTNADAQFLLGKFGIVSRQFDKAIVRLEKVVSLRPKNYDAVFLLAVAYSGKGDNKKATELLDKCAKMVDKPELRQKIEEYKKSLTKDQ
jgi:tetratricopeptide (TPR) repeat protein